MPKKIYVEIAMHDKLTKAMDKVTGKVRKFGRSVGRVFNKLATLRNAAVIAGIGYLSKSFISAAMAVEVYSKQLEVLSGSAKKAKDQLLVIREIARTSPLETEDVVASYVRLRAVGIDLTTKSLKTLGGVAVLLNRDMTDILDGFIGLNKRTLRKMGVEIDRQTKMAEKKAVLMSDNIRKVVQNDSASIREALIELWEERFPNAIVTAADTFSAQIRVMKSNVWEFKARLGEDLLPYLKKGLDGVNDSLEGVNKNIKVFRIAIMGVVAVTRTVWNVVQMNWKPVIAAIKMAMALTVGLLKITKHVAGEIGKQWKNTGKVMGLVFRGKFKEAAAAATEAVKSIDYKKIVSIAEDSFGKIKDIGKDYAKSTIKDAKDIKNAWLDVYDAVTRKAAEEPPEGTLAKKDIFGSTAEKPTSKAKIAKVALDIDRLIAQERINLISDEYQQKIAIIDLKEQEKLDKLMAWYAQNLDQVQKYNTARNLIEKTAEKERSDVRDKETADIKAAEAERAAVIKSSAMSIQSSLSRLAVLALEESKANAEKKKKILLAIAIAEGAAAAVSGVKIAIEDSNSTYEAIIKAAAVVLEVGAITATEIAAINNASFARGTSFAPGGRSLVGEEGPEMIDLPRGSVVHTAAQTKNMMGGVSINPQITINGNADAGTVQQIGMTLNSFAEKLENGIRYGQIDLTRLGIARA